MVAGSLLDEGAAANVEPDEGGGAVYGRVEDDLPGGVTAEGHGVLAGAEAVDGAPNTGSVGPGDVLGTGDGCGDGCPHAGDGDVSVVAVDGGQKTRRGDNKGDGKDQAEEAGWEKRRTSCTWLRQGGDSLRVWGMARADPPPRPRSGDQGRSGDSPGLRRGGFVVAFARAAAATGLEADGGDEQGLARRAGAREDTGVLAGGQVAQLPVAPVRRVVLAGLVALDHGRVVALADDGNRSPHGGGALGHDGSFLARPLFALEG